MTEEDRFALAQQRLRNVLRKHTVANARTLENKIADAGPFAQRIEPHVLTPARQSLQGSEIMRMGDVSIWFYLKGTDERAVNKRLAEQQPIHNEFQKRSLTVRIGQSLEIAVYRALIRVKGLPVVGGFRDLDSHDDSSLYSKEEPPSMIGDLPSLGAQRLDFIIFDRQNGPVGIEVKNIREWLYPNSKEVRELLNKCCSLDAVPVLIARRYPYVTFRLLSRCGVIVHQTYNQLLPYTAAEIARKAKDKRLLGYHDIRVSNEPDARLNRFVSINLLKVLPEARARFNKAKNLLYAHATLSISDEEFAAEVIARF